MKLIYALLIAFTLSACASLTAAPLLTGPISTTPAAGALPIPITNPAIVSDLEAAAKNLDQAVAIGALAKDDPAPACLHDAMQKAGIELPPGTAPAQSFEPVNDGVISLGSILYIRAQQLKAAAGQGVKISQTCLALIGQIHLDALMATAKVGGAALGLGGAGSIGAFGGLILPGVGLIK